MNWGENREETASQITGTAFLLNSLTAGFMLHLSATGFSKRGKTGRTGELKCILIDLIGVYWFGVKKETKVNI